MEPPHDKRFTLLHATDDPRRGGGETGTHGGGQIQDFHEAQRAAIARSPQEPGAGRLRIVCAALLSRISCEKEAVERQGTAKRPRQLAGTARWNLR